MGKLLDVDMDIIKLLQKNARMSLVDIAESVSLSRTSVKKRINTLVEQGYISRFTVDVPATVFDKDIAFFFQISDLKVTTKEFRRLIDGLPEITELYSITGSSNYIGKGYVAHTDELNQLLEKLMKYGNVHTSLILEQVLNRPIS